jgi:hypothetical protein
MPWEPRWPRAVAFLVCVLTALTLLWPLLTGQILFGGTRSDMFIAGYAFRLFGAEQFKATGAIPQWNPYLFGGLPYIAAMHGDIFYPTAWLRWIMPVDLAITWGMALHFVLAAWFTYGFARALRLSWTAAVGAGVAYQLTGIVASQMSPGHDGKLFVSALTPLAFWVLLTAVRGGQRWAFGAFSLVVALLVLGHYQMCYFLLLALGLWTLYLVFWDSERPRGGSPWVTIALAGAAVLIGVGIAGLQALPFLEYIKYSPRAAGGPNTGWEWVNTYAMPPSELFTAILPEFNGVLDRYWGSNPIKFHTEYLGVAPIVLACLAWGDRERRRLVVALLIGAGLFQLLAFAGHTPLYRLFFEVLPMLKKMRAVGMVFFLVAFPVAMLAGIGLERVLRGQVDGRRVIYLSGGFVVLALLGAGGVLQFVAEGLASQERMAQAQANASALRLGALRLLMFSVLSGGVLWALAAGRASRALAALLVVAVTAADLWSIDRQFYEFSPRASVLFKDDAITSHLKAQAAPFRVLNADGTYPQSTLMAYRIATPLGYHGNELRFYDELGGKEEGWRNLSSPNLIDLLAVRFLTLQEAQAIPGFHQVVGPITSTFGMPAVLYERDTVPPYARVIVSAAKIPDAQIVSTVLDPRFPADQVVLYPDTTTVQVTPLVRPLPASGVTATVAEWSPGAMRIALTGRNPASSYLLVAENWYPDWKATVDGSPATVQRADHSLLSVILPSGAREVTLRFESRAYERGKVLSLFSLLAAITLMLVPMLMARRAPGA